MNFEWAVQQLREGKRIRRAHWCKSFYLQFRFPKFDVFEMNSDRVFRFKINSFLGKDWEIYKEKGFCLSNEREAESCGTDWMYHEEDVRKLIRLGDKIFYAEDYGNDKIPIDMFIYAQKRWDKFKKLLGDKLTLT